MQVSKLIFLDGCPSYKGELPGFERTAAYDLLDSMNLLKGVPDDQKMVIQAGFHSVTINAMLQK